MQFSISILHPGCNLELVDSSYKVNMITMIKLDLVII